MSPEAEVVVCEMLAHWDREERSFWRDYAALRMPPGGGAQDALAAFERERGRAYLECTLSLLDRLLAERIAADPGFRAQVAEVLDQFISGPCRSVFHGSWKGDEAATAARLSMVCDLSR